MMEQLLGQSTFLATATTNGTLPLPNSESFGLVLSALILLGLLMYAVFFFGRKLVVWRHWRDDLVNNETEKYYSKLMEGVLAEASAGPIDMKDPPPASFGPVAQLWMSDWTGFSYKLEYGRPYLKPEITEYATDEEYERAMQFWKEEDKTRIENLRECSEWEQRERVRFKKLSDDTYNTAKQKAEDVVPKTMDVTHFGQSWTFLLEFSTIIVIIFAIMILAILGILDGAQIAPILAAIAGYVLGKTASEAKGKEEPGKATTDRVVAEIAAKKAVEDKAAADDASKKAAEDKEAADKAAKKAAEDKAAADKAAEKAASDKTATEKTAEKVAADKKAAEEAAKKAAEDRAVAEKAAREAKK